MEPNNTLKLKCRVKFSFYLCLFLGVTNINAQIIYTDIEPDFISTTIGDFYNLDLNNDGIVDFSLESSNLWPYILQNPNGVNAIAAVGGPFDDYLIPLSENTVIASPGDYFGTSGLLPVGICDDLPTYCVYDWEGAIDKYLGLRFLINGQTHFGWARLDVINDAQWVIKDYAYQASPNTVILSGQMPSLGLNNTDNLKNIRIASFNKIISIFNLDEAMNYKLYSINGQKKLEGIISKQGNIINTLFFSHGVYIIELTNPKTGQTVRNKVII